MHVTDEKKWLDHIHGCFGRIDASPDELNAAWQAARAIAIFKEIEVENGNWRYFGTRCKIQMHYDLNQALKVTLKRTFQEPVEYLLRREPGAAYKRIQQVFAWPSQFDLVANVVLDGDSYVTGEQGTLWLHRNSGASFSVAPVAALDESRIRWLINLAALKNDDKLRLHDYKLDTSSAHDFVMRVYPKPPSFISFVFEFQGQKEARVASPQRTEYAMVYGYNPQRGASDASVLYNFSYTLLDMIAPDPTLKCEVSHTTLIRGGSQYSVYGVRGFEPPRLPSEVQAEVDRQSAYNGILSPSLSHISRYGGTVNLELSNVGSPGTWRTVAGHGCIEDQGHTAVYTPTHPPSEPPVDYATGCITRIPAATKASMRAAVDVDTVEHVLPSETLQSHVLVYNAQATHFFRVFAYYASIKLELRYYGWGEGEQVVDPDEVEWTILQGNGQVSQDGVYTPSSSFTTFQAVHRDPNYWYWAVITLPGREVTTEDTLKMLGA